MQDQNPEGKYEALTKYGRDLTQAAREGKLDPVIGRDDEIRRSIQILSRRTKNNPVLIGESCRPGRLGYWGSCYCCCCCCCCLLCSALLPQPIAQCPPSPLCS